MADDTKYQAGYIPETGLPFIVYSGTGDTVPVSTLDTVALQYQKDPKSVPKGFVVLPGTLDPKDNNNVLPAGFGGAVRSMMGHATEAAQGMQLAQTPQSYGPAPTLAGLQDFASQLPSALVGLVNTPEKLGGIAGTVAGQATANAVVPGIGLLPGTARAVGSGLGYASGALSSSAATGGSMSPIEAALGGAVVAAGGGALEAGNYFINKYLVGQEGQALAKDIVAKFTEKNPSVTANSDLLKSFADTPEGLKILTQQSGSALVKSGVTIGNGTVRTILKDVVDQFPVDTAGGAVVADALSTPIIQKTLQRSLSKTVQAIGTYLDNVANGEKVPPLYAFLDTYEKQVGDILTSKLASGNLVPEDVLRQSVSNAFMKLSAKLDNSVQGAEFLAAMKESGQSVGFNPQALWQSVQDKYLSSSPSLMNHMGEMLKQSPLTDVPPHYAIPLTEGANQGFSHLIPHEVPGTPNVLPAWVRPTEAASVAAVGSAVDNKALKSFTGQ